MHLAFPKKVVECLLRRKKNKFLIFTLSYKILFLVLIISYHLIEFIYFTKKIIFSFLSHMMLMSFFTC